MSRPKALLERFERKPRSHPFPPGPAGYLFPSISQLQSQPLEYLGGMWREYGDLVRLPILPGFTVILSTHPDDAEHILSTHSERYGKADFFLKFMGMLQGEGLFTSEGEYWRSHRRLMQPAFHQKQLVRLHSVMLSCVNSVLQEWDAKPDGEVFDIAAEMTRLTLKIVSQALFSVDISNESDRLGRALRTAFEYAYHRITAPLAAPLWVPTHRNRDFRQAKQTIDSVVLEIIQSRRQNPGQHSDLLSMLLAAQDENTGKGMSDQELLNEVITLINAGHETTATALSWTWHLLGAHPNVMGQLQDEVDSVLQGGAPTFEKLPQLAYTRRIFDESLRLCPPGMGLAPRVAKEDDDIQNYFIPKGSILNIAFYFTLRHPDFWENPEQFDPDRFLPEQVAQRPKYAYMPWGAGPHICIGKNFAVMESIMILSAIVQRFQVTLVPNQSIEIDPRFTLSPKHGVRVTLQKRR